MNAQVLVKTGEPVEVKRDGLLDLTDIPLDELLHAEGDTALDEALRRAVASANVTVSAFNSAI